MTPGLIGQAAVSLVALYLLYAYLLRFERQVLGRLNLGGKGSWADILWPILDAGRALVKTSTIPLGAQRWLYAAAPLLVLAAAAMAWALLPLVPVVAEQGLPANLIRLDTSLPLLLAANWLGLAGVLLGARAARQPAHWAQARAVAWQGWRYSFPAIIALVGVVMLARSLDLAQIVQQQAKTLPFIVYQPLGVLVVVLALLAGGRRLPYTPAEEGDALLADFHWQHAGAIPALYHLTEYLQLIVTAGLIATVYLAGWHGPWLDGPHWLAVKTVLVALGLLWLRRRWLAGQRQRFEGSEWFSLTLLAVFNVLLTAVVMWVGGQGG